MKRFVLAALLAAVVLTGCIVPGRANYLAMVPAPIVVAHVHGPYCGHFWGVWEGRPVYRDSGRYSYWNGAAWIALARPPVVYHARVHRPDARYHYHSRGSAPQARERTRAVRLPKDTRPPQASPHRATSAL